ncbi:MAG: RHS repeat domain-containing protein [Eubacterium sp.]
MHNVNRIEFTYDGFGRVTGRTYSNTSGANRRVTTYTYQDVGTDKTTTLLKSVNNSGFGELGYEYDAVGNITQITKNGAVQETYTYDALNQLKTVTRNGITTEYNYQNGNITSVTQNGTVIKTYGYTNSTWSDLLTSFNGQTITYDEIGNPLQYRDGMSFTWAKGRQLQSVTKDGLTASYTYDENGLRLSKTVNGVTTNIFRTNGQMVGMNSSDGKDMTFILDGNGNVYGVHYDHYSSNQPKSETYYFAYNAQGDVIGIYEFSGRLMATYDYDEWGNCTVNVLAADNNGHAVDSPDHIAYANPFRYRGYFYDAETGFYYLNSRYYDPGTGRFVNGDGIYDTDTGMLSHNMFAYCNNNPINMIDSEGTGPIWNSIKAAAARVCKAALDFTIKAAKNSTNRIVRAIGNIAGNLMSAISFGKTAKSASEAKRTHAANVVNAGISQSSDTRRTVIVFDENIIPDPISYQKHCEDKYETMLTYYRMEYSAIDDPYKNSTTFDKDISGIPFENLNPYQQQVIINTMPSWDKSYTFAIGLGYAAYAVYDLTQ